MSYQWQYTYVGGIPRVRIETADDIRNLPELDAKLWTVLSCPVKGLNLDENVLHLLDANGDGAIHVNEVKDTVIYLSHILKDLDLILTEGDDLPLSALNRNDQTGARLAQLIEDKGFQTITLSDVETLRDRWCQRKERLKETMLRHTEKSHPYGDRTEQLYAIFQKVEHKIDDFFARCAVVRYAENAREALDVRMTVIEQLSDKQLTMECSDLDQLPLCRINKDALLTLNEVNPAWMTRMTDFFDELLDGAQTLSETEWNFIKAKMNLHRNWLNDTLNIDDKLLDNNPELADRKHDIEELWKLTVLRRDFFKLLRNYVNMTDFYEEGSKAVFQAGELYIDQRCCSLCMEVADYEKSLTQGNDTGMFLIYCNCQSKSLDRNINIVAALTAGSVRNVKVGKHALFYDRLGNDYDAVVTNIIDNPISIGQAFYSPYRKFVEFIEKQAAKLASDKNEKVLDKASSQVAESSENVATAADAATKNSSSEDTQTKREAFDIAKYCGIFAAIGMAIGYIGGFLTELFMGFVALKWWQMPIAIAGLMLLISGPSMILAWMKLRKRNLAPLLNANGWAVNCALIISISFGNKLSTMANIPKIQLPKK